MSGPQESAQGLPNMLLTQLQFKPKTEAASPAKLEGFLKSQVLPHCYAVLIVFLFHKSSCSKVDASVGIFPLPTNPVLRPAYLLAQGLFIKVLLS